MGSWMDHGCTPRCAEDSHEPWLRLARRAHMRLAATCVARPTAISISPRLACAPWKIAVVALMSVLPRTRGFMPSDSSEIVVQTSEGKLVKHRLFMSASQSVVGVHVAELLRDVYHEVILLTDRSCTSSELSSSPVYGPLGQPPQLSPSPSLGCSPAAGQNRFASMAVLAGSHPIFSSLLSASPTCQTVASDSPRSDRSTPMGSPASISRMSSMQLSAAFNRTLPSAWLQASGARSSSEDAKRRQDVVGLLEKALQQARAMQMRVAIPLAFCSLSVLLATLLLAMIDMAAFARTAADPNALRLRTDAHVMRLAAYGAVLACLLVLTLLALLPYFSLISAMRSLSVLVVALQTTIAFGVAVSAFGGAMRSYSPCCVMSFGPTAATQEHLEEMSCEAGPLCAVKAIFIGSLWVAGVGAASTLCARAAKRLFLTAWSRPHELLDGLWSEAGFAVGACAVLQTSVLTHWLALAQAADIASARTAAEVGLTTATALLGWLLLLPRFRRCAQRALSRLLVSEGLSVPVALLIGFYNECDPKNLYARAEASFRAVVLDNAALSALETAKGWTPEESSAAGEVPATGDAHARVRGCGKKNSLLWASKGKDEDNGPSAVCATVDYYLCYSTLDDNADRLAALRAWALANKRQNGVFPTIYVDALCADESLDADDHLAHLPIYVAKCRTLLLLCGPTFTDRLYCCVELYVWRAMGGSLEDVEIVLVGTCEQLWRKTVASFDAFHVMYGIHLMYPTRALARSAQAAACLTDTISRSRGTNCRYTAQASREHDHERLVHAVKLAGVGAFNSTVRGYVPLVLEAVKAALSRAQSLQHDTLGSRSLSDASSAKLSRLGRTWLRPAAPWAQNEGASAAALSASPALAPSAPSAPARRIPPIYISPEV